MFVATGPYRLVRNPMYLGAAGVILGAGLLVRSPAIVLLAAGFLVFFHLFVEFYEEPALRAEFGDSYLQDRLAVRRWLPRPLLPVAVGVLVAIGGCYLLIALAVPDAVGIARSLF